MPIRIWASIVAFGYTVEVIGFVEYGDSSETSVAEFGRFALHQPVAATHGKKGFLSGSV